MNKEISVMSLPLEGIKVVGFTQAQAGPAGTQLLAENFGPGAMDRMGFSWKHLRELNPKLIYGSVKGLQ
jgi:crotonobetainyl-CoA:carnitine CoA-transferase CaiB-like acyl-CoA transferase